MAMPPPRSPARASHRGILAAGFLLALLALLGLGLAGPWRGGRGGTPVAGPPPRPGSAATPVPRQGVVAGGGERARATPPPEAAVPVLPVFDAAMKARLAAIHARGLARGMRPDVLAKVGDSITVDGAFLTALGCGTVVLGEHQDLAATIDFFRRTELPPTASDAPCAADNSWTRVGPAARNGWSAVHVLRPFPPPAAVTDTLEAGPPGAGAAAGSPISATLAAPSPPVPAPEAGGGLQAAGGLTVTTALTSTVAITPTRRPVTPTPPPECQAPDDSPLRCEVRAIRPGVAIVMFGTNDLEAGVPPETYAANLDRVVGELVAAGVIPILSTIPPRTDREAANARVSRYNVAAIAVAAAHGVPLVNFWRALAGPEMRQQGMSADGIHPNALDHGATLTGAGLHFGQNQRNLTLLQTLDKLRRVVYEDGPPEG